MTRRPLFSSLQRVLVPVLRGRSPLESVRLAQALTAETVLLGVIPVAEEETVSRAAGDARRLRGEMRQLDLLPQTRMCPRVRVSAYPWAELREVIGTEAPDLTLLEWPDQVVALGLGHPEKLTELGCDLALIRGPVPDSPQRVLVALRGGPNAELETHSNGPRDFDRPVSEILRGLRLPIRGTPERSTPHPAYVGPVRCAGFGNAHSA